MNLALWIITGLLAAIFLFAGANKLILSRERLARAPAGGWVNDFSPAFIKRLGAAEILGAAGLIVPAAVGVATGLVPLAAAGLATIMAGAAIVTYRRQERGHALLNVTYFVMAAFVACAGFGLQSLG